MHTEAFETWLVSLPMGIPPARVASAAAVVALNEFVLAQLILDGSHVDTRLRSSVRGVRTALRTHVRPVPRLLR